MTRHNLSSARHGVTGSLRRFDAEPIRLDEPRSPAQAARRPERRRRGFRGLALVAKSIAVTAMLSLASCALEGEGAANVGTEASTAGREQAMRMELVAAARSQIGRTVVYDARYAPIAYPMGDRPRSHGMSADVVIRAFRDAAGVDLQVLLHEDMRASFHAYPEPASVDRPDPNIDHRRVANLERYLDRIGARGPEPLGWADLEPGDVVTWRLAGGERHIGIVSDRKSADGARPLIIHNFSMGAVEEDFVTTPGLAARFRPTAETLMTASNRFGGRDQ